jgi:DNA-binding CsgD family transcriptional regulator
MRVTGTKANMNSVELNSICHHSGRRFEQETTAPAQSGIIILQTRGSVSIPGLRLPAKPFREDSLDAVRAALDHDRKRREYEDKINGLHRRYNALSEREQQVMIPVAAGLMNKQVAAELGIAEPTAKVHRHKIMKKPGARTLADLVRMACILGLPQANMSEVGGR